MNTAEIMNWCDAKADRLGLTALTDTERTVALVSRINFEVELGGLDVFYYNSAGNEAVATVAALEAIGATQVAGALRAANALFPGGVPSRDRGERFEGLQAVRGLPDRPLDALTDVFYQADPDVFSRLCTFIETHFEVLMQPR